MMSFIKISMMSLCLVLLCLGQVMAQVQISEDACYSWGAGSQLEMLSKMGEKISSTECYAKKKSYDRLQPDEKYTDYELIKSDKEVCDCLSRKSLQFSDSKKFEKKMYEISNRSIVKPTTLEKSYYIAKSSFQNLQAMNTKAHSLDGEVSTAVFSCPPSGCKNADEVLEQIIDKPMAPNQCVSHKEWLSLSRIPRDKILLSEFNKDFKEDDWKQSVLQKRYDELMKYDFEKKKKHKDEILSLKSKLKFLFKNPQFAQVFGADHGSVKKDIIEKADIDSSEVEKAFKKENIQNAKSKLFGMLKSISAGCDLNEDTCLNEKVSNGQIDSFQKEVNNFILRPEITPVLKVVSIQDQDIFKRRDQNFKNDISFYESFKSNPSQRNLTLQAVLLSGENPSDCTVGGPDFEKCSKAFSVYCGYVEKALPLMESVGKDESLNDDLDFDRSIIADDSLETNADFRNLNNAVCNTRRKLTGLPNEYGLTFFDFKKSFCESNPSKPDCQGNDLEKIKNLREIYLSKFTIVADPSKQILSNEVVNAFIGNVKKSPVQSLDKKSAKNLFDLTSQERNQKLQDFRESSGLSKPTISTPVSEAESGSSLTKTLESLSKLQDVEPQTKEKAASENFFSSNAFQNELAESVNTLTPPQRVEQLEKFKDQHSEIVESLKKDPASEEKIAQAKDLELKIAALEASLAEVRKQNELLGTKLSDQVRQATGSGEKVARPELDDKEVRTQKSSLSQVAEQSSEALRSPASVKTQNFENAGSAQVGAGAGALGSAGGKASSSSSSVDSTSKSSIEREEAKLVSLRQGGNGLLIIETAKGQMVPNAITVPVPEDIYRMVQSNPSGFSLSQIEKRISKEQIFQLEKHGEIVLLLQNGSNPPIEVKVRKEKNGLVQVENTKAIVRKASLGGLQQTFKNY